MDIDIYKQILNGLKDYNKQKGELYGNIICSRPTYDTCYPYTQITEIRNTSYPQFNSRREHVSNLAYKIDIYAKDKGKIPKMDIARGIMKLVDGYMTDTLSFLRMSIVPDNLVDDDSLYRITIVYTGDYYENRKLIM